MAKPKKAKQPDPVEAEQKKPESEDEDIHAVFIRNYERDYNKEEQNIIAAYDDLKFRAATDQWDEQDKKARGINRPALTIDKTSQFVRQVTGDIRQMRPAIKVVPVDDLASQDVAGKVMPGMIRYIEQRSDAQGGYFAAADSQVACGVGHLRVSTEYASQETFNQEIRISAVEDGVAVVWDADSVLPTREDAKHCTVPVDMSRAAFEAKYSDAGEASIPNAPTCFTDWTSDDYVRVAEYWVKESVKKQLAVFPNGSIDDLTDAEPDELEAAQAAGAVFEEREGHKICRYIMSASEVLEGPTDWPGPDIPIVPMWGEEIRIGRQIIRRGIVRPLKPVQQMYNYAASTYTESLALQPKAPFVGTDVQFRDFPEDWEGANNQNLPYLRYTVDPKAPGIPQRSQPPVSSTGLKELMALAQGDMSAVTGIYPAALGAASNETSGRAITARQREGDTGTFVYVDNFARAIRRVGKIVVNLIPYIYDTPRTVRIVGEDGKIDHVSINKPDVDGKGLPTTLNDVTVGAYDVVIEMGPSFSTKREEARDGMQAFLQAMGPSAAPLFIDLFAKQQDWPLSDKIAKRAMAVLPPHIQAMEAQEAGEPMPNIPQPPPSPEEQAKLAEDKRTNDLEQQKHQIETGKLMLENKKIEADLEIARMNHEATMAGHAAAAVQSQQPQQPDQPQQPQQAQGGQDPRVDALADAVKQLRDIVMEIAQAVAQQQQAPPEPSPMDFGPMSPMDNQPPPGGFSFDGVPNA